MGRRSATDTLARILGAMLEHRRMTQSELARRAEVDSETVAKRMRELQDGGVPLTREEEGRAVVWSVAEGWFPDGVLFEGEDAAKLLRLLLRLPSSSARDAFVARIASAASSGRDVKRAARVTLSSRRDVDERAVASAEDLRAQAEEAIVREWAIELKYLRVGDEDPSWRTVSPQTVVSAERPYLVAWDHAKSALRHYRLDRMQRVTRAEGVAFREVSAAVVDAHVRESFHGYRGGELREVSWVFSDEAWATAKDNLPFTCERREPVAGGVRVVVKSRGGDVLVRFLLAYGARVTIETPRVRDEVIALARKALEWHEAKASGRGAEEASGGSRDTPVIRGDE